LVVQGWTNYPARLLKINGQNKKERPTKMKMIKLSEIQTLTKKDYQGIIRILPTALVEAFNTIQLPIKNKKIALLNVAEFLQWLNMMYSKDNKSLVVIPTTTFERYFNNRLYPAYKQILKDLNILTQVQYENGMGWSKDEGIAKQYRIHNEYLNTTDFTVITVKEEVIAKVNFSMKTTQAMLKTLLNETLNYEKVFNDEVEYHNTNETSKFSLFIRLTKALSISTERYIKQGTKSDRVYHSFSNLSRITRKCFFTKFFNIDLKNSQPTMLVLYMLINKIEFDTLYQRHCEDGVFYEQFYNLLDRTVYNTEEDFRNEIKRNIYKGIFFAFNTNSEYNFRFRALYPKTWKVLQDLNKQDTSVASILQNTEADIFNNLKVKTSSRYYTLFDAIYYNNKKDTEDISKQILKYGEDRGVKFTLKYE